MRKMPLSESLAYGAVGLLSVSAAFMIALKFVTRSNGQEPPPSAATAPPTPAVTADSQPPPPAAAPAPAPDPAPAPVQAQDIPPPPAPTSAAPDAATAPAPPAAKATVSEEQGREASELEGFLEPFIYDSVNRRDPFMPYSDYVQTEAGGGGPTRPLTPAQRFDLDQLKLIGIMWDVKDPKAMFLDPEAEVMVLGRDEGIGNRNGYIAAIREGEVVVVEAMRRRGDIIYKTRVLRIER